MHAVSQPTYKPHSLLFNTLCSFLFQIFFKTLTKTAQSPSSTLPFRFLSLFFFSFLFSTLIFKRNCFPHSSLIHYFGLAFKFRLNRYSPHRASMILDFYSVLIPHPYANFYEMLLTSFT